MTDIDTDAIRPLVERYPTATDTFQMDLALRIAEASPALLAKVDELTAALTQSREQAATHANQIGRLVAENARLRQQRDAHTDVVEAAKAWRDSDDIQLIGVDEIGEELVAAVDALPKAEATR